MLIYHTCSTKIKTLNKNKNKYFFHYDTKKSTYSKHDNCEKNNFIEEANILVTRSS